MCVVRAKDTRVLKPVSLLSATGGGDSPSAPGDPPGETKSPKGDWARHAMHCILCCLSPPALTSTCCSAPSTHTHAVCSFLPVMWCGLSVLQEQEELHSYRARVLAELGEEKRRLESHIAEIQEGRVREHQDTHTVVSHSMSERRGYSHCVLPPSLPPSSLQGESDSTTDLDTSLKGESHHDLEHLLASRWRTCHHVSC